MTHDERAIGLLTEMLEDGPTKAPHHLLAAVLDDLRTAPQGRRGLLGWHVPWPQFGQGSRRLAAGLLVVAVIGAVVFGQLVPRPAVTGLGASATPTLSTPGSATPAPSTTRPEASPSSVAPSPDPSLGRSSPQRIEGSGRPMSSGDVTRTSARFDPAITFFVSGNPTTGESEWCPLAPEDSSARMIVLRIRYVCVTEFRVIRPYAVDCGTPDAHPGAEALATAILARVGRQSVHDRGTLQTPGALPPTFFGDTYQGRVIEITAGDRSFDATQADPDHCRLLPAPGSLEPVIELRGDSPALLVLLDIHGELVVVRLASGGYDAATGAEARDRGAIRRPWGAKATPDLPAIGETEASIFAYISDITFGPPSGVTWINNLEGRLPDGAMIQLTGGLRLARTPAEVERLALDQIAADERLLGRVLAPARVLRVMDLPAGATLPAPRADGTNPTRAALGPHVGDGWVVVAEGTQVHTDRATGAIDRHGTRGYFWFDDRDDAIERIIIPCWTSPNVPVVPLEGSCP